MRCSSVCLSDSRRRRRQGIEALRWIACWRHPDSTSYLGQPALPVLRLWFLELFSQAYKLSQWSFDHMIPLAYILSWQLQSNSLPQRSFIVSRRSHHRVSSCLPNALKLSHPPGRWGPQEELACKSHYVLSNLQPITSTFYPTWLDLWIYPKHPRLVWWVSK